MHIYIYIYIYIANLLGAAFLPSIFMKSVISS